jgi:hypothetical protein
MEEKHVGEGSENGDIGKGKGRGRRKGWRLWYVMWKKGVWVFVWCGCTREYRPIPTQLTRSFKLSTPLDPSAGDAVLQDSCEYLSLRDRAEQNWSDQSSAEQYIKEQMKEEREIAGQNKTA